MHWMKKGLIGLLAVAVLSAGGWGIWRWVTYPTRPDLATVSLNQAVEYIGSDDFNRLFENHRKQYCLDLVEKMRENTFPELLTMVPFGGYDGRRRVLINIRHLEARQEVEDAMLRLILDKFYEQSPEVRAVYLTTLVMMDEAGKRKRGVNGEVLPSPERLRKDMSKVIGRQSPHTVARFGQFLVDIEQHRRGMGMKPSY